MEFSSITSSVAKPPSFPLASSRSSFFTNNGGGGVAFLNRNQANVGSLVLGRSRTRFRVDRPKKGLICNSLFGLGVPELVVIAGVAALVFGPKKLPEVGKSIGKTVKSFQQAAKEFESELKSPEPTAGAAPVDKPTPAIEEEEQDAKVPSSKDSV